MEQLHRIKTIWITCLRLHSQHEIRSQSCLAAQAITTGSMRLLLKMMWNVSLSVKVMQTIWWSEVRYGTKVAASSSTGYADGQYTDKLDQTSDGLREWLSGGDLGFGSGAGRWFAYLAFGLGSSWWLYAARLSASGRCAKAAA